MNDLKRKKEIESARKKKKKLKTYQKWLILGAIALFVVATIILLVIFREYVFASQTWTVIAMLLIIVLIIGFGVAGWYLLNGKE